MLFVGARVSGADRLEVALDGSGGASARGMFRRATVTAPFVSSVDTTCSTPVL
ncbi:hypothetical protein [Nonomuraea deserti]|uniref:hypothetical protein n=1 Tax=Nonomuraea deserti TaxID=1848322 RepID=UPI0015F2BB99|nr:hypothetical protein [Nonomuraea deserti]